MGAEDVAGQGGEPRFPYTASVLQPVSGSVLLSMSCLLSGMVNVDCQLDKMRITQERILQA